MILLDKNILFEKKLNDVKKTSNNIQVADHQSFALPSQACNPPKYQMLEIYFFLGAAKRAIYEYS